MEQPIGTNQPSTSGKSPMNLANQPMTVQNLTPDGPKKLWRRWLVLVVILVVLGAGIWLLFFRTSHKTIPWDQAFTFCVDDKTYTTPVSFPKFYGGEMTAPTIKYFLTRGNSFYTLSVNGAVTNLYPAGAPDIPASATKHSLKAGTC